MKLNDLLRENNLTLSDKGTLCLVKAITESNPLLLLLFENTPTNQQILDVFGSLDQPDEEVSKVLSLFTRYVKLWAFS